MYASNSRAVSIAAEYLLRHNPCSRIQMAQDTGLTASIVTHTVKLMMDAGFVQDTGVTISKKKRQRPCSETAVPESGLYPVSRH